MLQERKNGFRIVKFMKFFEAEIAANPGSKPGNIGTF